MFLTNILLTISFILLKQKNQHNFKVINRILSQIDIVVNQTN